MESAIRCKQSYVNSRWLGGMMTNWKTVKKSIDRYKAVLETLADEERVAELSKKELARQNRLKNKYEKSLAGIKEMSRLPEVMFVIDVGGGGDIPREKGPGVLQSDLLVVNKSDIAPHVDVDLALMLSEAQAVRASVGLCDVTTLGKIDVQGADAGAFLDRIYSNAMASLKVGRVRYGLMLREDGILYDDGTCARLADADSTLAKGAYDDYCR